MNRFFVLPQEEIEVVSGGCSGECTLLALQIVFVGWFVLTRGEVDL